MTLNLVVLHPACIYVAADFALMDWSTREPYVEPSMKVVQFSYKNGVVGVITYAGIGSVNHKSTAELVVEWLTGLELTALAEVAQAVRENGTKWLSGLARHTTRSMTPPAHTFVVVGYESSGDSNLYLVSNHQAVNERPFPHVATELAVSQLRSTKSARVRVTGQPQTVPREQRKLLARTVDAEPLNSGLIRTSMLGIIERASTTAEGLVSANGAVFLLLPGGSSQQSLTQPANVDLHTLFNGHPYPSMKKLLELLGLSGRELVSATSVTDSSAPIYQDACGQSLLTGDASNYALEEIHGIGDGRQTAIAIDDLGTVLGTSADADEVGAVHFWHRSADGQVDVISMGAPSYQTAGGFDGRGNVYISRGGLHYGPPRIVRIVGGNPHDLEALDGLPCGMTSVSTTGWVAGFIEVSDDITRADRQQAARWDPEGRLVIAPARHPGFAGNAMAIASDGAAAVVYTDISARSRCARWRADGELEDLQQLPGASVYPTGISDQHHIVGVRISGERVAVFAPEGGGWQLLGPPPNWEPGHVTAQGWVLGSVKVDGFRTPSVRYNSGALASLPTYRYHSSNLMGANDRGDIVGSLTGDHCSHAIVWHRAAESSD